MWCKKVKNDQKIKSMGSCLKKIPLSMYDALMDKNTYDKNRTLTFNNILAWVWSFDFLKTRPYCSISRKWSTGIPSSEKTGAK